MSKQILIDAGKFEHLLNCMAQLDFLPMSGRHADESIVRESYLECRQMWLNAPEFRNASPPDHPFLHASSPVGMKCADCTMDQEPCPMCYAAGWQKKHPNTHQV